MRESLDTADEWFVHEWTWAGASVTDAHGKAIQQ
jgi:hypothetical protein